MFLFFISDAFCICIYENHEFMRVCLSVYLFLKKKSLKISWLRYKKKNKIKYKRKESGRSFWSVLSSFSLAFSFSTYIYLSVFLFLTALNHEPRRTPAFRVVYLNTQEKMRVRSYRHKNVSIYNEPLDFEWKHTSDL